jgi:hypothetical protein
MRLRSCFIALSIAMVNAGCAKSVPEPAPHPTTPHISWEIKVGDGDNPDKTSVCQSDPRSQCVVPASTPDHQVFATVHLYFHPATVETKYSGTVQLGLFEGSPAAHELKIDATVKPDDSPGTNTIYDIVTSKAGTDHVLVLAVATPVPSGRPVTIRDDIIVVVK